MSIGKNSINRVAAGLDSEEAAPITTEIPSVELERTIVNGTAEEAEKKPAEKKPAAKKPSTKKPAAKKTETKKTEAAPAAAPPVAPELEGQAVAAPTRRGRKPGSKNKTTAKKTAAKRTPTPVEPRRRTVRVVKALSGVAIGEELPVYLL